MEHHLAQWRGASDRGGDPAQQWAAAYAGVVPLIVSGRLADAEATAEASLALGTEAGQPDAFTTYAAQLGIIRYWQGRLHELIPALQQGLDASPEWHAYRAALALAHAHDGNPDEARRLLDTERSGRFAIPEDETWLSTIAFWAQASGIVGHSDAAEHLHAVLEPFRELYVYTAVIVGYAVATCLGILEHTLGRYDDADRSFAQGDAMHQRLRSPMLMAEGRAHWAAMLADRNRPGDRERARELATGALTVAIDGGHGYIAAAARRVLAQLKA